MTLGEIETWFDEALYLLITGNLRELTIVQAIVLTILIIGLLVILGSIFEGFFEFLQKHGAIMIMVLILISVFVFIFFS